jgi:16S rRNA (guanine527-N7)-methyltransferase
LGESAILYAMNDLEQIVASTANDQWSLDLSSEQLVQLSRYAEMLVDWNTRLNLTRIVDEHGIAVKHFLDSLAVLPFAKLKRNAAVIDVGTGAGLPGIALKIARPDLEVTLLDSTAKKLAFCDAVVVDLGLEGVRTVHARAEDLARDPTHARSYDCAVARALAPLEKLLPWCAPFVRPGGQVIALKGPAVTNEMAAAAPIAARLGLTLSRPQVVELPGEDAAAHLIVAGRMRSF